MSKPNILPIAIVTTIFLLAGFMAVNKFIYQKKQAPTEDPSISSYEQCVQAGYPSMDSYPPQCETASGKRFVQNLPEEELTEVISPVTVSGTITCLEHWDMSGPITLECAIGLLAESGEYYSLRDPDQTSTLLFEAPMNTLVEVTGQYIPGSDARYRTIGTIEIESIISD